MSKLIIVGAGGHGKVVAETAFEMNKWDEIAFLDDRFLELTYCLSWPVIGKLADIELFRAQFCDVAVAIGNNALRIQLLQEYYKRGFNLPTVVSPSAYISRYADIGQGTVIFAQAAINASASVGSGCIINTGATIDHDCMLEEGVHISPGVHLAGEVKVGNCSWVGTGASIIPGVSIGQKAIIGAGTVVLCDVPNEALVVGVPGKIRKYFREG